MKEDFGRDIDWIRGGYLFPVYDREDEEKLKSLLYTQKSLGLNIDWLDKTKTERLVPGINMNSLRGCTYSPDDGFASPLKVIGEFYRAAENNGARFIFGEDVREIKRKKERIIHIRTSMERYGADIFINASGARAGQTAGLAGTELPVYGAAHEAGVTEPVERFLQPMIVDIRPMAGSDNCYFYQSKAGAILFCTTPKPEIREDGIHCTSAFLPRATERLLKIYPALRNIRVRRTWRGLYPMTPDGLPIVGYSSSISNMIHAAGMCGQGFMLGPGLGKILAEIIVDKTKKYDSILEELSPLRNFSGAELLK